MVYLFFLKKPLLKLFSKYYRHYYRSIRLFHEKRLKEAIKETEKAILVKSEKPETYHKLGKMFSLLGYNDKAVFYYKKALNKFKKADSGMIADIIFSLMLILADNGIMINEYEKIIKEVEIVRIDRSGKSNNQMFVNYIFSYLSYKYGRFEEALKYFNLALKEIKKENFTYYLYEEILLSPVFYYFGIMFKLKGEYEKALEYFKKSIKAGGPESIFSKRSENEIKSLKDGIKRSIENNVHYGKLKGEEKSVINKALDALREIKIKEEIRLNFRNIKNLLLTYNIILTVIIWVGIMNVEELLVKSSEYVISMKNRMLNNISIEKWFIIFIWIFSYKIIRNIYFKGIAIYGKEFTFLKYMKSNNKYLLKEIIKNILVLPVFIFIYSHYGMVIEKYLKDSFDVRIIIDLTIYGISYLIINFIINSIVKWKSDEKEEKLSGIDELRRYYLDYEIPLKLSVILGVICLFVFFITGVSGSFFLTEYITIHFILLIFGIWHMRKKRLKVSEIIIKSILIFIPYGIFIAIYTPSKRVEKGERIFSL